MKLLLENWRKYLKEETTEVADNVDDIAAAATYTVQGGDTLSHIASKFKVSLADVEKANPQIEDPHSIQPGQQIFVPKLPAAKISTAEPAIKPTPMSTQTTEKGIEDPIALMIPMMQTMVWERFGRRLSTDNARVHANILWPAMKAGGINNRRRIAAFISQISHESAGFRHMVELGANSYFMKYEPGTRRGVRIGNTKRGDGARYKGRGYIQLTGRYNYQRAGKDLGLDLEGNPALAASPENAARIAVWFWNDKGNNANADDGLFDKITQSINPGASRKSKESRKALHAIAKTAR